MERRRVAGDHAAAEAARVASRERSAAEQAARRAEMRVPTEVRHAFACIDIDGSQSISAREFLRDFGGAPHRL